MNPRLSVCSLLLLCGLAAASADAQSARLRRLVVVGDSLLAGFGSGGLVARGRTGQLNSASVLVARQAGVSLPLPLMASPGVPPPLVISDDNDNGQLDPGEVRRTSDEIGFRSKPGRPARNLAIPGEDTQSVFEEIGPDDIARQIVGGSDVNGRDVLKFLILGLPPNSASVSQLTRARDIHPTFLMVWLGSNDILEMATSTDPGAVTLTPAEFGQRFLRLLNALADTQAGGMAVGNLPDVTGIAALRPAAGEVTSCRNPDATTLPVTADDLLSIDLPRSQLPVPPCTDVLDANERAQVRATVTAFNAQIAAAIAQVEQTRGVAIAPVDLFSLFDQLRTQGVDLDGDGTPDLTTGYLGGVFSLDGIHPTRTGHALIANAFIDAIDQRFGEGIPHVNVARVAAHDPLVDNRFRPAGEAPFGLIGDDDNDLATFFTRIFDRVSSGARSFGRDLLGRARHFFEGLF
jgi:lysophospholipase L1-like esterase